ncbi:MAG: DEAD/DEAH box helicase [Gammaproteobacteria bacterium]|nr:DEAD/DEAH box helicase [Gammaproteobacteria bacterium]
MKNTDLLASYNRLASDQKTILELKTLICHPFNSYELSQAMRKSDLKRESGEWFNAKNIDDIIRKLKKQSLLEPENNTCNLGIAHDVMKQAVKRSELAPVLDRVRKKRQVKNGYYSVNYEHMFRDCRILLYLHEYEELQQFVRETLNPFYEHLITRLWGDLFYEIPIDIDWLRMLPVEWQEQLVRIQAGRAFFGLNNCDVLMAYLSTSELAVKESLLAEYYLLTGNFKELASQIDRLDDAFCKALYQAALDFCCNRLEEAVAGYSQALKIFRKNMQKRKIFFDGYDGVFFVLALLALDAPQHKKLATECIGLVLNRSKDNEYISTFRMLNKLNGAVTKDSVSSILASDNSGSAFATILFNLFLCLLADDSAAPNIPLLEEIFNVAVDNGYHFVASICAEVLSQNEIKSTQYQDYLHQHGGKIRLLDLLVVKSSWELTLEQLAMVKSDFAGKQVEAPRRLIWQINLDNRYDKLLYPIEQKLSKKGVWSKGKKVSFYHLHDNDLPYLTEHDRRVCAVLPYENYYYSEENERNVLLALVGHKQVYDYNNPSIKLKLDAATPELIVTNVGDDFHIKLSVIAKDPKAIVIKESANCYKVTDFNKQHVKLAEILTRDGLIMPEQARDKLLNMAAQLSEMLTVYTPVASQDIPCLTASTVPEVQLSPCDEDGLFCEIGIRPFSDFGPVCEPGIGSPVIMTVHEGRKVQVARDLQQETDNMSGLAKPCPILAENIKKDGLVSGAKKCLQLLAELRSYSGPLKIVWPQGERFNVKASLSFNNLHLRVKQEQDWFAIDGEVKVDNNTLMSMQELLDLLDNSSEDFIQLGDDKFVSLTDHFKRKLLQLKNVASYDGKSYLVHKLSAGTVDDVIDQFDHVELDAAWQQQIEKIKTAKKLEPKLPAQLTAELRPYQHEGYKWLCRLANWGVGACLADDMGLGKTVQAIALLLKQSSKGPSLVVAPTSVCHNWLLEINRFAPTLKAHIFADHDRGKLIKNVAKKEVVICSYGLLQSSIELLKQVDWQVVVLDEAQAIKNSSAKRTKAVWQLNSNFRLALTGTPIENHLGELWSLFRFLNPGYFSTEKEFFQRFIVPIEQQKDEGMREALKRVIQPFILRRLKGEVLTELPPRIEQTIEIEQSDQEKAFYESVRVKAVDNISNMQEENVGKKKIKILAEITKLRQVCCHPTLAYKEMNIESSKLKKFFYLLDGLIENQHRVLVFSQFVQYLTLIRQALEQREIKYQYLDGQTPAKKRKNIISAFQDGTDNVFLLSLKAGGVGLNLTAADYVIILDPWWNPAVEDQAADRAHRIGQTKPVTIYRLITNNTIEEKIVQLHKYKKDLASDLLSGTNASGKLGEDELLQLIQGR